MPRPVASTTTDIGKLLDRFINGDETARDELVARALARLNVLAQRQLWNFPGVRRWAQADDVVQGAAQRLHRALMELRPRTPRDFFALCSQQIRRELLDLKRKLFGPEGIGKYHASPAPNANGSRNDDAPRALQISDSTNDPARLARWTELHARVEALPAELREAFDLLWYHELTHAEAAQVLDLSAKTVSRRWREARMRLHDLLEGGDI